MKVDETSKNLTDFGPVSNLVLPANWIEQKVLKKSGHDTKTLRKFHSLNNNQIQFCAYYRGLPVAEQSAVNFSRCLAKQPGALDNETLLELQEVLGPLAITEEFTLERASVKEINGKKVLAVEGHWPNLKLKSRNIFIDANGDGSIVYELYYAAPEEDFDGNAELAALALSSIIWNPN